MRWMSDDLDSRIFFTLKNHVVLQCVLKYLDVVNRIQFLTFLKLNKGWSYKDNIITVGENWDVTLLLLCFFPPQNRHWNKNKLFPKNVNFYPNRCIPTQPLSSQLSCNLFLTKAQQQWDVKSEVEWGLGAPTLWGSPAVLLVTFTIGSSQDSFYYSALQNVFFSYNFLPYHS